MSGTFVLKPTLSTINPSSPKEAKPWCGWGEELASKLPTYALPSLRSTVYMQYPKYSNEYNFTSVIFLTQTKVPRENLRTTFDKALTNSFHMSVMILKWGSNPQTQRWKGQWSDHFKLENVYLEKNISPDRVLRLFRPDFVFRTSPLTISPTSSFFASQRLHKKRYS